MFYWIKTILIITINNIRTRTTYKQKNKWLLIGAALAFCLISWISIRPTIKAYFLNKAYKKEIALAETAPQEIARYQQVLKSMKSSSNTMVNGKERLFEVVSNFAAENKLVIKALGEPEITNEGNYTIATHKIEVQGNFQNITKLIYELEQIKRVGNVVSTTYKTKKDRRQKRKTLIATIYLQHVSQKKSSS